MVCGNCALPLGKGATAGGGPRNRLPRLGRGPGLAGIWRWALPLGLVLLVSAYLAQWSRREPPSWPTPEPLLR